eukprot:7816196-Prorocentrum_lima.AAC.1
MVPYDRSRGLLDNWAVPSSLEHDPVFSVAPSSRCLPLWSSESLSPDNGTWRLVIQSYASFFLSFTCDLRTSL